MRRFAGDETAAFAFAAAAENGRNDIEPSEDSAASCMGAAASWDDVVLEADAAHDYYSSAVHRGAILVALQHPAS